MDVTRYRFAERTKRVKACYKLYREYRSSTVKEGKYKRIATRRRGSFRVILAKKKDKCKTSKIPKALVVKGPLVLMLVPKFKR